MSIIFGPWPDGVGSGNIAKKERTSVTNKKVIEKVQDLPNPLRGIIARQMFVNANNNAWHHENGPEDVITRCAVVDAHGHVTSKNNLCNVVDEYKRYFGGEDDRTFKFWLLKQPTWQAFVDRSRGFGVLVADDRRYYRYTEADFSHEEIKIRMDGKVGFSFGPHNKNRNFEGKEFSFEFETDDSDCFLTIPLPDGPVSLEFETEGTVVSIKNMPYRTLDLPHNHSVDIPIPRPAIDAFMQRKFQLLLGEYKQNVTFPRNLRRTENERLEESSDGSASESESSLSGDKVFLENEFETKIKELYIETICRHVKRELESSETVDKDNNTFGLLWLVDPARDPASGLDDFLVEGAPETVLQYHY
jgi:hypothetical protein